MLFQISLSMHKLNQGHTAVVDGGSGVGGKRKKLGVGLQIFLEGGWQNFFGGWQTLAKKLGVDWHNLGVRY